MVRALEGIRVADLSHVLAAPTTSMILADLGAEVIHIEPLQGDDARQFGPFVNGQSSYFISINRNKKSIVLDLKKQDGKQVLRDLIRVSDVVLENYRPATMARLGFSYSRMRLINPKIIYASICGYGHDALPGYDSKPAYDMVAQAYSGIMSITGPDGGPPVRVGTSVGDIVAGHQAAIGILAALRHRDITGKGQMVDQSMVDALVYILENAIVRYTVSGTVPKPLGTAHPSVTPFQGFRTKDGWIITPVGNDALWKTFCEAIERPDLANHPKFKNNPLRTENRPQLVAILEKEMVKKTTAEWLAILEKFELPYSPINTIDRVVEDPNINYRKMIVEVDQPEAGKLKIAGSPFHLSETPGQVYAPAPLLGQHTEEVLREILRYTKDEISELRRKAAVYTREDLTGSKSGET
jgi:CoA:oxalate CoA-transferase